MKKAILNGSVVFIAVWLLAVLTTYFYISLYLGNTAADIHLHDTFGVSPYEYILPLSLCIAATVHFLLAAAHWFNRVSSLVLVIISVLAFDIALFKMPSVFGYTTYPALAAGYDSTNRIIAMNLHILKALFIGRILANVMLVIAVIALFKKPSMR